MSTARLEHKITELERKIRCIPKVTQESISGNPDIDTINFPSNPCSGYIHMVDFKSSTNAWFFSYVYEDDQWVETIAIVGGTPDISITISPVNTLFSIPQSREGFIQITPSNGAWGLVEVIIQKPTNFFTLQISSVTTMSDLTAVGNPTWNIEESSTTFKLTKTYPSLDTTGTRIGFTLISSSPGTYNMLATVTAGSGNEFNTANNSVIRTFIAS